MDGAHIKTLFTTYFYRHARPIIEKGYLYYAVPPLYKVKKGKQERYATNETERDAILAEFGEGCEVQRYKGLGEMNPEQLRETTMNKENRTLIQVTIEDAEMCETIIQLCMGDNVSARKDFITENAIYADCDI